MSNINGSNTIENLIEKLMHQEIEISTRALQNLENKINLKTINFEELDFNTINKIILTIIEWITKNFNLTFETNISRALLVAKEALKFSNETIFNNLKSKNILNFISNISNSRISQNVSDLCEEFIKIFLSFENKNNNFNFSHDQEQNFTFNQNNMNQQNNTTSQQIKTTSSNYEKEILYNNNLKINQNCDSKLQNFQNDMSQYKTTVNILLNKNLTINQESKRSNNNFTHNHQQKINNNFASNLDPNIQFFKEKNNLNFSLNGTSSFPLINISKEEEQIFYDSSINLKFGDSLHISKTLNYFYFNILNDYPIEYILQNSELLKTIMIILEKSNHLEYGNILFRIIDKIFFLLENKIQLFSNNLSLIYNSNINDKTNSSFSNNELDKVLFYPLLSEENNSSKNINKNGTENQNNSLSIRDFLIVSIEALIISAYNQDKLPFSVILIEKNLNFLKKLMIDNNDDEWTIIIKQIIFRLNELITYYKTKKINFHNLAIVFLRFILSLSDSALIKFANNTNYEIIFLVKDIIFIFDDSQSNIIFKLLLKIKRILSNTNINHELFDVMNNLIEEYEKAQILKSSIDIAKRINYLSIKNSSNKKKDNLSTNKNIYYNYEEFKYIIENFNNLLLAYKYFIDINDQNFIKEFVYINVEEENSNINYNNFNNKYQNGLNLTTNEKKNNVFQYSDKFSFIRFLSLCYNHLISDEQLVKNEFSDKSSKILTNADISDCLFKLISFLNSLNSTTTDFKLILYSDFLNEIKSNDNLIYIINWNTDILLGLINDLSESQNTNNEKFEYIIIEIIQEIINKTFCIENQNTEINKFDNFYYIFEILPIYYKNMKMLSLNAKIEKKYIGLNGKILKYLRLLFSNNELIRLNSINFFRNLFDSNNTQDYDDRIIEYVEFSTNYEKLKKLDLIYSIQTAEKEYTNIYNNIISDSQSLEIEFFPLLNILYSNKMDYNLKTSAIEQLIYLTFNQKYTPNFTNEIIFFCFDIVYNKLLEYKNLFENYFVFNDKNYKSKINNEENEVNDYLSNYHNINSTIDNFYKDSNLNYISALMKLLNIIILNNSENESVKNFLILKKNDKLLNFIHCIIIQLFPNDNIEKIIFSDVKKPKNKHFLNVNLIFFLFLISFNLNNSYNKKISKNVNLNNLFYNKNDYIQKKKKYLLDNYSLLNIHEKYYFNIIPIKNFIDFSYKHNNYNKDNDSSQNLKNNLWNNYEIKKNIIEFIQIKTLYANKTHSKKTNEINNEFIRDMIINLYDIDLIKSNLNFCFNDFNSNHNFLEIFLNTSKLFEYYLDENFKNFFNNLKTKDISKKTDIKINNYEEQENINFINEKKININSFNYDLVSFEDRESNELVQIFSFLKSILPNNSEEKNIIIDILNSIKVFLSFYKSFFYLKNINDNQKNEKINIINYENFKNSENHKQIISLPLIKKGLNDCVYNYLSFICNSKSFMNDFQNNQENQLFFIELFDLIINNEELFDTMFYKDNIEMIIFIIKNFIHIFYNNDNLYTVRLLVTKLCINLFKFFEINNIKTDDKIKTIIYENKNFLNLIFDSIEFFVSNYKSIQKKINSINKEEDYEKFNCQSSGKAYLNLLKFRDFSLIKNNFILLKLITENNTYFQDKIVNKSYVLFKYLNFYYGESEEIKNSKNNIIFTDIIVLIIDILENIKSPEGKFEIIKNNPGILTNLFDFIIKNSSSTILTITLSNFLNILVENLIQNNSIIKLNNFKNYENSNNLKNLDLKSQNNENNLINNSQNFDNINPINEYENSGIQKSSKFNDKFFNSNKYDLDNEHLLEEIIIFNEKIYDISSLFNLLNILKKNFKNTILASCFLNLLKKLILLAKLRIDSGNNLNSNDFNNQYQEEINFENSNNLEKNYNNINNYYDIISNTTFFEVKNELVKIQIENFMKIVNFIQEDYLNNYIPIQMKNQNYNNSIFFYNNLYYDKLSSKINKLHNISESLILIGDIIDILLLIFAKSSNFVKTFQNNKIIILDLINNIFKFMSLLKNFKNKINKNDFNLFFNSNNFYCLFENAITKYFSLIHFLYFKDENLINENFLEISFYLTDILNSDIKNKFSTINEKNNNIRIKNTIIFQSKRLNTEFDEDSNISYSQYDHNDCGDFSKYNDTKNENNDEYIKNSKALNFIYLCYDLLALDENNSLAIKISFAKILPNLIETIIYFNQKIKSNFQNLTFENRNISNIENNDLENSKHKLYEIVYNQVDNSNNIFLKLKNEGDTILQLMTSMKEIYKIKYDNYDTKIKCKFLFDNSDLSEKNTIIYAISSILLVSQSAKRLFIKSNFINTFLDYLKQISEKLLELNLDNREKETKSKKKNLLDSNLSNNFDFNEKISLIEYLISEYKNILILLQNLFCDFSECPEKNSLFISLDNINHNLLNNPNITSISNVNNNSFNSSNNKKSNIINSNITYKSGKTNQMNKNIKMNITGKINVNITDSIGVNSNLNSDDNNFGYSSKNANQNQSANNFMKALYEIFHDTLRYDNIHENYLKLLINIISKNDLAKKSFIISISNPESVGNKDSFIIILLEYFQKKFLLNNLNNTFFSNDQNIKGLDLFIKLLKCLFQNKQIVLFLLKIKFIENFQKDILNLLQNKKYIMSKNNQICINYLLNLFVSLTFDHEISKKIADKELIQVLTDSIIKIKNENIIYNILFIFRNLSFVNQNKAHFLANENLLGTIFAVLSGDFTIKIKFIISHLLWILLFNNQTLKTLLNKEAFKNELITTQMHLQKEFDVKKYMKQENKKSDVENYEKYLEESCVNFKKIIHILDT